VGRLVSELVIQLKDLVSGPAVKAAASLDRIGKAGSGLEKAAKAQGASDLAKQLERLQIASRKAEDFRNLHKAFADSRVGFVGAQQAVQRLARELANTENPTRKLAAEYRKAQRAVKDASSAFEQQKTAVQAARRELEGFDVPIARLTGAEARLRASIEQTTRALAHQGQVSAHAAERAALLAARKAERRGAASAMGAGAVASVGSRLPTAARAILHTYREYDDLLRYQRAVADLAPEERESRQRQALHLGGSTRFNDLQVLEAQLSLTQRGVKKEFVEPFVAELVNYAQAMNTDLPSAATTLEGIILSTNKNIEDATTASQVMRRTIDLAVKMAKLGGLDSEGIAQAFKFGGASGHTAGLSDQTMSGMFATLHRLNFSGDEAGVAVRAIAAKLVAPTTKGLDALEAMGIHYNDFTKMPGGMSAQNLEGMANRRFGKGFSAAQRDALAEIMADPDKVGDREKFVADVSTIVAQTFEKGRHGKLKAQDATKVAKLVSDFYKLSVEGVDAEGLLHAVLTKNPSLALANAMFTDKHGGKIASLAQNLKVFDDIVAQLQHVKEGFAKEIAEERMAGFAGALSKLEGALLNAATSIGRAFDADGKGGLLTGLAGRVAGLVQGFAELNGATVAVTSAIVGLGGTAATIFGAWKLTRTLLGFGAGAQLGASAAALGGSATALTEAAVALNLAAGRIGAKGVAEAVSKTAAGTAAGVGAGAAAGGLSLASILTGIGILGGVAGITYAAGGKYQSEERVTLNSELVELNRQLDIVGERISHATRMGNDTAALETRRERIEIRIREINDRIAAIAAEAGQQAGGQIVDGFKSTDWAGAGAQAGSALMWSLRSAVGAGTIGPGVGVPGAGGSNSGATGVPARAAGGPIDPNTPTLVGEYGPELITARRGGYIHTAGETRRMLSGGQSRGDVHVHISAIHLDAGRGDLRGMASQLVQEIDRQVRAAMRGLQADLGYTS
jgi:TP901 family phage tail tape measure protein